VDDSRYSTRIIRTTEELRTLEAGWDALLAKSVHDSLFLTWDWVSTWAEVYVPPSGAAVVVGAVVSSTIVSL